MNVTFHKYHGAGNDFIILNNFEGSYSQLTPAQIKFLCHRRKGIGADGLMFLNRHPDYDFEMVYHNADGMRGSMCGNGGRCLVRFAYELGMKQSSFHFLAADGEHEAKLDFEKKVSIKMKDVDTVKFLLDHFVLDTGSPHYVRFVDNVQEIDVQEEGAKIRYNKTYAEKGINVDFVQETGGDTIFVRTYERGVEAETLSCGTGVTAAALLSAHNENGFNRVEVRTRGGDLSVEFEKMSENKFTDIWLGGPVTFVFNGEINLKERLYV